MSIACRQSYREWHNDLRIRQMTKALVQNRVSLDDLDEVKAALRAANFTDDCVDRLAAAAAQAAASAH